MYGSFTTKITHGMSTEEQQYAPQYNINRWQNKKKVLASFSRFSCVSTLTQPLQKHLLVLNFTSSVDVTTIHFTRCFTVIALYCGMPQVQIVSFVATLLKGLNFIAIGTAKPNTMINMHRFFSTTLSTL